MELIIYPRLSDKSKKAIKRAKKKWGHPYRYTPRSILIARLCEELGFTKTQVIQQIKKEREYLLKYPQYY